MRLLAILPVGLALASACAGKSRSGGDGAPASGGSGGSDGSARKHDCDDERRTLRELINDNKSCSDTSDCRTHFAGCGVTEDDCTGAVYTNVDVDPQLIDHWRLELTACVATHEPSSDCSLCERAARPPACTAGRCVGASECGLEAAALWDFKSRNDACRVDDDCVTEVVGCEVTEDDCTGAVYYAADFDRVEFERLRDEYYACAGTCGSCFRELSPPACVSGHCRIRPLRTP